MIKGFSFGLRKVFKFPSRDIDLEQSHSFGFKLCGRRLQAVDMHWPGARPDARIMMHARSVLSIPSYMMF